MSDKPIAPAHPSATVILIRDVDDQIEALLLRRNSKLAFHGGAWVFPGGRIDAADYPADAPDNTTVAARRAAVREANEEASLALDESDLIWYAHWTTPETQLRRFATWFYIAAATDDEVEVDGGEIHAHEWMQPGKALAAQKAGEIELPPPTFVTLLKLSAYGTTTEALAAISPQPPEIFVPRYHHIEGGTCSLYEEDAGYESGNVNEAGPRHRLYMIEGSWRYERDF